jgi:hypothetical protein
MANTIAGMFSTPEAIRDQRIAEIAAAQRQAAMPRGGSISDLNAVVAGGGYLQGQMFGEQLGGMLGLKTREEDKAAQIQDMASNLNLETPQGLALFARMLNNQGMTEEAMRVFELAKVKEKDEYDRKRQEEIDRLNKEKAEADIAYKKKLTEAAKKPSPDWEWKSLGKEYNPETFQYETTYGWVNPYTQEVKRVGFNPNPPAEESTEGDVKIGTTAESLQESWGG